MPWEGELVEGGVALLLSCDDGDSEEAEVEVGTADEGSSVSEIKVDMASSRVTSPVFLSEAWFRSLVVISSMLMVSKSPPPPPHLPPPPAVAAANQEGENPSVAPPPPPPTPSTTTTLPPVSTTGMSMSRITGCGPCYCCSLLEDVLWRGLWLRCSPRVTVAFLRLAGF